MILPKWNLDTDTFNYRIRVKDRCVLTDEEGYRNFYTTKAICNLFDTEFNPSLTLKSLVDTEQAIWIDLTEEERAEYMKERPWWKKLFNIGALKDGT